MVNNPSCNPPTSDNPSDEERRINSGPLYELRGVQEIARENQSIRLVTKRCRDKAADLGWSNTDIAELICQLNERHYHKSEWCLSTKTWLRCDSYVIPLLEYVPTAKKEMSIEYYIKFSTGPLNNVLLIVSCHP